ncbi:MAG: hypothetical protein V4631_00385 [Pseudomonadota bacterium]
MNTKHILIAALLAGAFAPAMAVTVVTGDAPRVALHFDAVEAGDADDNGGAHPREVVRERIMINGADAQVLHDFGQAGFDGPLMRMRAKPVKNAPYSAEAVSEQSQTLFDGNQIVNKTSSISYRDSAGRTRQETRGENGTVRRITIHDPVAGSTYILNPEARTATKLAPHGDMSRMAFEMGKAAAARAKLERLDKDATPGREEIIIKRVERGDPAMAERVRENVRIHVTKAMAEGGHPMPGLERLGPLMVGAFGDMKWSTKSTTKDLGTKEIDGVKAQGKLRSYDIPAGEIGNRNAIVVANETWYSPELQVTVLSKRTDPRSGERSYRLVGLKRDEPAAALFAVPSDYTVRDVAAMVKKSGEEKK